ncbi:MAG: hypothetical protein II329_03535 [Clostridia bacterium]|nr:hypothetical protein [Clostridia bacterium]
MTELIACPTDLNNKKRVSKMTWLFMALFFLLPLILNNLVIIPIYATLEADVVYSGSMLTIVIKYLQDFFDLFAFSSAYALIIFSALLLDGKRSRFIALFYSITYLLVIPVKMLMNVVIYGSLGNTSQIIIDVIYLGVYFVLYLLQLLVVYIFAATDSSRYISSLESLRASKRDKARQRAENIGSVLPFSKFIDWYNPLQRSAIKMSALITAIKVGTRIINDVSVGAPESFGEVMIMVVYYLSDLIYGAVAYIVAIFIITLFFERLKKKDGDVSPSDKA